MTRDLMASILAAGEAPSYHHLGGERITVLLSGEQTGGAFAMLLDECPAGGGPPLHVHAREEETFHVLEGALEMQVGERRITAGSGATVFIPRGLPHTFHNPGPEPSKTLALLTPAGLEGFFPEVEPLLVGGEPDMEAVLGVAGRFGITAVGPPLG